MGLYESVKNNLNESQKLDEGQWISNSLDTWVDPRSNIKGWKVKVLDVIPDDYAGATTAKVELFDPKGKSQGEDIIYIHRQKVKIGKTYKAYIDGIMAMPRILGVDNFTLDEVPDMRKVTKDLYETQKLNEHTDSWLTNTDPTNHRVKPFVDFFKKQYPDKQIDKLWLEGVEGGWESCVAFIESDGTVYRIYLDELNDGIYMSHPSGIKIVSNNFKNDYDYIDD